MLWKQHMNKIRLLTWFSHLFFSRKQRYEQKKQSLFVPLFICFHYQKRSNFFNYLNFCSKFHSNNNDLNKFLLRIILKNESAQIRALERLTATIKKSVDLKWQTHSRQRSEKLFKGRLKYDSWKLWLGTLGIQDAGEMQDSKLTCKKNTSTFNFCQAVFDHCTS